MTTPRAPVTEVPSEPVAPDERTGWLLPARALLGWMSDSQAVKVLASGRDDADGTPEQQALILAARARVVARTTDLDQGGIVTPLPP
jgi:hypothetical protein